MRPLPFSLLLALAALTVPARADNTLAGLLTPAGLPGASARPSTPIDGGATLAAAARPDAATKAAATTPQRPPARDIGSVLAAMPRDDAPAVRAAAPARGPAAAARLRAAAAAAPAPAPAPLLSPDGQPLCPSTPAATYQCVPYGYSPDAAPSLKACVNLCAGPPVPGAGDGDAPTCLNCGDPGAACKKAHGEFGTTFTYTLLSKEREPCYVPPPPAREGDADCAPNQGDNNRGNNVGSFNKGDGNQGDGNRGSFNIGNKNVGSYNRGSCNRGDGNQGSNLAGNYLVGNGNNPCPF